MVVNWYLGFIFNMIVNVLVSYMIIFKYYLAFNGVVDFVNIWFVFFTIDLVIRVRFGFKVEFINRLVEER